MKSLAAAFAVIGKEGQALDSRADAVLRIVKDLKIKNAESFNEAVREAYVANGWNAVVGKPKAGVKVVPVPSTVKQYVSAIRGAFALELRVLSYSSFYALRQELKATRAELRAKAEKKEARKAPELVGIRLVEPAQLTGAIFHDLAVLHGALDNARRPRLLAALERVKRDFSHAAPQLVVPQEEMRKAA
jgi:hypothetical protein